MFQLFFYKCISCVWRSYAAFEEFVAPQRDVQCKIPVKWRHCKYKGQKCNFNPPLCLFDWAVIAPASGPSETPEKSIQFRGDVTIWYTTSCRVESIPTDELWMPEASLVCFSFRPFLRGCMMKDRPIGCCWWIFLRSPLEQIIDRSQPVYQPF